MSAIDTYARFLKTAASAERPHTMLPGRTTVSKRGSTGTIAPKVKKKKVVPEEELPEVVPTVVSAPGAPKVDISFSVKVGAAQEVNPSPRNVPIAQRNTGAQVDGSFTPDSRIGGGYGTTTLPEETDVMRTPALPGGEDDYVGYVGDVKISSVVMRALRKVAEPQPALPLIEDPVVAPPDPKAIEEEELQQLLQNMKEQNPSFYGTKVAHLLSYTMKLAAAPESSGAESPSASSISTTSTPSAPAAPDPAEGKRKEELHGQQMRFNEDKHGLELKKMETQLQQDQETHQLEQGTTQVEQETKQLEQSQKQQELTGPPQDPQLQQAQQAQQYQQNIMAKAAAIYTDSLEPVDMSSPLPALGVGAGIGGAAAHTMLPNAAAQHYRDLAGKITPQQIKDSIAMSKKHGKKLPTKFMEMVSDMTGEGNKVKFKAPAHVRSRYFKNRALQSNAPRLLKGTGLGLLAGLAAYSAMRD